ncbi:ribosomal protein L14 [Ancylostoma ceylanicum]|uniref:Large ribosomal subunit protein eL14 n=2 Tax=Ancylostoma ceylanicum TaxID=53326 RepID=A0A0D6MCI9_9BILA|nr:ribosomal protein L14 [Ancylostoma ceylanicum]
MGRIVLKGAVGITMVFKRLVQIGRVVFIAKGKDAGKIATVVDVVDGNRVLIDGPSTGVIRSVRNLKDLQLTKFVVKIRVGQRTKGVKEAFDAAKINEQFKKTLWAKKIAQKAVRAKLTDYERFKLMKAKQMRNRLVRVEFAKLRKAAK